MGLLEKILGTKKEPAKAQVAPYFKALSEYNPVYTSYSGGLYEQSLTRAAIDRFATGCSKLKPEIQGTAKPRINRAFKTSPNQYMTWPRFLYRLATILECDTTAYVVPAFDRDGITYTGIWPLKADMAEIVEYAGEPWIRFTFASGDTAAIELRHVCILSKFQYISDFFGSGNVLDSTMKLLHAQEVAQENAIKAGSTLRFIAALQGQVREEEMAKKRMRFSDDNLSEKNSSGMLVYDNTFAKVEQIKPYSYTIESPEMERINNSVYTYFGTNEDILQNHFNEDHWNAFYEGRIEPFAIQLGEGLSHMLYTQQERNKNFISFSSNRLEYATSASKRNMIRDMLDRGVFCLDDAREILQLPPLPNGEGQIRVIRGEYIDASIVQEHTIDKDATQHDMTKKDTDQHGTKDFDSPEGG